MVLLYTKHKNKSISKKTNGEFTLKTVSGQFAFAVIGSRNTGI